MILLQSYCFCSCCVELNQSIRITDDRFGEDIEFRMTFDDDSGHFDNDFDCALAPIDFGARRMMGDYLHLVPTEKVTSVERYEKTSVQSI